MLVSRLQPRAWAVSLPGSAPRAAASVYVSRAWSFRRAVRRRPATSRAADKCLRRVLRPWGQMGARWGLAGPCWGRTARAQPAALVHPLPLPCISVVFAYSPSHITLSHTFNLRSVYIPFCPVHPQDAVPQVCPCCASIRLRELLFSHFTARHFKALHTSYTYAWAMSLHHECDYAFLGALNWAQ